MDGLSKDVLLCVISLCDVAAFVRLSAASHFYATCCKEWLNAAELRGYRIIDTADEEWRREVKESFSCSCGAVGWHVRRHCSCFVGCSRCGRNRPYLKTFPFVKKVSPWGAYVCL